MITRSGNFTFSSHAHDAGADNIHYTLAAVLMTRAGMAVTLQHQGGLECTTAGLPFGTPDRDDQVSTGHNQILTDEFDAFLGGVFSAEISGTDVLATVVEDALKEAAAAAGAAAATAVIALI